MFTPSSTASTIAGVGAGPSAVSSRSVAGRLFTTLASTAATPATASRLANDDVDGTTARKAAVSPCAPTAATTTPRPSTNRQNRGAAAVTTPHGVIVRRWTAR